MSSQYRQAYSDKTHFSVPADAQDYSDEPHAQNGNGIYNDYTVDLQPREYSPTLKIGCFTFQNTRKTKFMLFGSLLVFCLTIFVLIVIASRGKKSSAVTQPVVKDSGLIAYGPDANGRVAFDPSDSTTYMPHVERIEHAMHDYGTIHQYANHELFINCNESTTTVPPGKVCRFTAELFGDKCQNQELYGLHQGRPCILLVLRLPKGTEPVPLNFTNGQNTDVKSKIHERASSKAIGISCEGKTPEDKSYITDDKHLGPVMDYHPSTGFPLYSFLASDHSGYVTPAVMVQFNTLTTNHEITVQCTAWGENLKNAIYSTEFTFHLD